MEEYKARAEAAEVRVQSAEERVQTVEEGEAAEAVSDDESEQLQFAKGQACIPSGCGPT